MRMAVALAGGGGGSPDNSCTPLNKPINVDMSTPAMSGTERHAGLAPTRPGCVS